jgi:hypothetical protein
MGTPFSGETMMNERIKELAEQATSYNNSDGWLFDKEKFAELIVRECADTVLGFHNQFGDSAHNEIRQHFGVEE